MDNNLTDNDRQRQTETDSDKQSLTQDQQGRELHNLTVLDVVKLFEKAGVSRSERSVARWCKPNTQGEKRLDSFLDPENKKYYITPESSDRVIEEEKSKEKVSRHNTLSDSDRQSLTEFDKTPEDLTENQVLKQQVKELEHEKFQLTASNKAYEMLVDRQQKMIDSYVPKIETLAKKTGALEERLLQIEGSKEEKIYEVETEEKTDPKPDNQ